MAYKRSRVASPAACSERPDRKKASSKKKSYINRSMRDNYCVIRRTATLPVYSLPVSTGWVNGVYTFRLSDLPNYTEFTALFNQYKIMSVKVTFFPRWSSNDASNLALNPAGISTPCTPLIWLIDDRDGTTTVVNQAACMQNSRARMVKDVYKPFSIYVKPKFQSEIANDPVGLTYASAKPTTGWLDTQNYNIQHSGIQVGGYVPYAAGISGNNMVFDVFATYDMQFKQAI